MSRYSPSPKMTNHQEDPGLLSVPSYARHSDQEIKGFFGAYRFLSNFSLSPVHYQGTLFPTVEHAYQAAKYPRKHWAEFLSLNAKQAKKLGRAAALEDDWHERKLGIMEDLLKEKFTRNPELGARLLQTGTRYLEETNSWGDTFYGVCNGQGDNNLGRALMELRRSLQSVRSERRTRFREVFGRDAVFLPVIHLHRGREGALRAVAVAERAGADGIFLINQGMGLKETLSLSKEIGMRWPTLWKGINPLGTSLGAAVSLAKEFDFQGLWMDDVGVDALDPHTIEEAKAQVSDARRESRWSGLLFGGTAFKTQAPIPEEKLAEVAFESSSFVDVVTTSGAATNVPAHVDKIQALSKGLGECPIGLASGVRGENVNRYLSHVQAFLVASGIEESLGVLSPEKCAELAARIHRYKG